MVLVDGQRYCRKTRLGHHDSHLIHRESQLYHLHLFPRYAEFEGSNFGAAFA